jgi:broad specificity phosphatase PhoE
MPTRFLLLRHAETTHPHVFNGAESDVPLSPRGERQARAIAPVLAALAPDALVSSGMQRALQTAAPIAQACGLEVRVEPDLHERRVGELQGRTNEQTGGLWTRTLDRWRAGDLAFAPPGAESFLDVQRRVLAVWNRLTTEFAGRTAVIVAHGHVCRVLLLSLLPGLSVDRWEDLGPIRNVAVTELVHSGESWQALRLNQLHTAVEVVNGID